MTPNAKLGGLPFISFGIPVVVVAPAPISFRRRPSPTPPTPRALRTSTDHGDATHEKRPTHTERAFGDAPRADAPRDAARKDFTREKRKASAQLDKKKARRARGRASPRAPRATEYKPNRTQKKKAKSRETNREPLPFRPSPLFAARRFSPIDERRERQELLAMKARLQEMED